MARPLRSWNCSSFFHIIINAHNKEFLFSSYVAKSLYLSRLAHHIERLASKYNFTINILAYSLMDNHFHFVVHIRSIDRPHNYIGSELLKNTNSDFAQKFNKMNNRVGSVFWDRAKVKPIQDYRYLREVIKYVILNPVKSGKIKKAKESNEYLSSYKATLWGFRDELGIISIPDELKDLVFSVRDEVDSVIYEGYYVVLGEWDAEYEVSKFYGTQDWAEQVKRAMRKKQRFDLL